MPQLDTQNYSPKVLASAASGVTQLIASYGADIESIFGSSGISTVVLSDPLNEIGLNQYCNLFNEAAIQTQCEIFGLRFGANFKINSLGPIGYIASNSPTLSAALTNFVKYFPAHQDNSLLSITQNQDVLQLNYEILDPLIDNKRQDAELSIGIFCDIFRHCIGSRWAPLEIHLAHPCHSENSKEYESVFKCPVLFNQPSNTIVFDRNDLSAIMPDSDPLLFSIIESMLLKRKELKASPEDLVSEITQHIKIKLSESVPTLAQIANSFSLSSACLQRKLKEQGVCYNDLLKVVRQELAIKYVSDTQMQLTEAAFVLGYSELSAFSRAFRTWTGMSPQKFRRLQQRRDVK